jgi:hypothetical protein
MNIELGVDPDVARTAEADDLVSKVFCAPQHEQILPGSDYGSSTFDAAHNRKS